MTHQPAAAEESTSNLPPQRRGGPAVFVAVLIVLLLVIYPLSIGPAAWLLDRELLSDETASLIYAPLGWIADRYEPLETALLWYTMLWIPNDLPLPPASIPQPALSPTPTPVPTPQPAPPAAVPSE